MSFINFKVIPCPNCNGKRVGTGPGFSNPWRMSREESICLVCQLVDIIICYSCNKVAERSFDHKCSSCNTILKGDSDCDHWYTNIFGEGKARL